MSKIFTRDRVKESLDSEDQEVYEELKEEGGFANTPLIGNTGPTYNRNNNEHVIRNNTEPNNAYITMGQNAPQGAFSGKGMNSSAEEINLTVGMAASSGYKKNLLGMEYKPKARGPEDYVDKNYFSDAAKITVSRQGNIYDDMAIDSIPGDWLSKMMKTSRSSVGVKADELCLVGRERVKIVTGAGKNVKGFGMGNEPNSLGGELSNAGIDLIGNNSVQETTHLSLRGGLFKKERLQPIPLGYNLADCLQDLTSQVQSLTSLLKDFMWFQSLYNGVVANHGHLLNMATMTTLTPMFLPMWNGILGTTNGRFVDDPMMNHEFQCTLFEINYLEPYGSKWICSPDNNTT